MSADPPDIRQVESGGERPRTSLSPVAARNAATAALGRVSGIIVGIVLTPLLLRSLGRDVYGVVTATTSAFEYLVLLRGGLGAAMRRHVTVRIHRGENTEARRHYAAGFWWGLIFRVPILVAGLLLPGPLCRFIGLSPQLIPATVAGVTIIIVYAIIADVAVVLEVPTYAMGNTAVLSSLEAAVPLLRLLLVVLAFHLLVPTLALYGWVLLTAQAAYIGGLIILAWRAKAAGPVFPAPSLGDARIRRELFSYGGIALVGQAAGLLWLATDNLLIGRFYGPAAVTLYSLGSRWMPLARGTLLSMTRSLTPLFTQFDARAEEARTRAALIRATAATAALAVPLCLVPCVLGDLFLRVWVGSEYNAAYPILLVTMAPLTLDLALSPVWSVLVARGRIGWVSTGDIVVAVGNVAISLFLARVLGLGPLGFALGNTLALLARNLLLRPIIGRRDSSLPSFRILLAQFAKALAGGAPALLLLFLLRGVYGAHLATVVAAGIVGGALCLGGAALATLGRQGVRQIMLSSLSARGRR